MRALLLALLLPGAAMAQGRCMLGCDTVLEGAEGLSAAETLLGGSLPAGAEVVGLLTGGFQDRFVQLRIDMPDSPKVDTVLAGLGTSLAALASDPQAGFGPEGPDWWDAEERDLLRSGPASLPGFASATVGVAPASDGWLSVFVWAFQT